MGGPSQKKKVELYVRWPEPGGLAPGVPLLIEWRDPGHML